MKVFTAEYVFDHPWDKISQGVFRKYPNPHKPEVMGTEVLERGVVDGKLVTHRLITSRFGLPSWSRKLLGSDDICYGYEVSQVDPERKILTMRSKNITFSSAVTLDERIVYKPIPPSAEHPQERTKLVQESRVTVHSVPFAAGSLENIILSSMKFNSHKGREAMEWVMHSKIDRDGQIPSSHSSTPLISLEDITETALKSVDEISDKALKSVDEFSSKVDEISGKAIKSIDEISEKAVKAIKYHEISEKALKSVDEIGGKAKEGLKTVDDISTKAFNSYWASFWRYWW